LKVSKERSGRSDFEEFSIINSLWPHDNVLPIIALCTNFNHKDFFDVGKTAIVAPFQKYGRLGDFVSEHRKSVVLISRATEIDSSDDGLLGCWVMKDLGGLFRNVQFPVLKKCYLEFERVTTVLENNSLGVLVGKHALLQRTSHHAKRVTREFVLLCLRQIAS
jgi:hypothetical protein